MTDFRSDSVDSLRGVDAADAAGLAERGDRLEPPSPAGAARTGARRVAVDALLGRARGRAIARALPYFGAVTPAEAWALADAGAAKIVDVRTAPERDYVGHVPGSAHVEWRAYGATSPNPDFVAQLAAHASRRDAVLLLCRSGQRSHAGAIAATAAGFERVLNILEGFEGDLDDTGQRGRLGGWRKAGLPWVQG